MPPREFDSLEKARMRLLREAKQLHVRFIKLGSFHNLHFQSHTMNAYIRCNEDSDARKVLDEMPDRNTIVWNTVICSILNKKINHTNKSSQGISVFCRMLLDSARPDFITFNSLLRFCFEIRRELHCFATKTGFSSNSFVVTALVNSYSKSDQVTEARQAFEEVFFRDCVLFNAMLYCYASKGLEDEAARVFNLMRSEGLAGDEFTLTSLLASSPVAGESIHGIAIRRGFDAEVPVLTALVDAYCKTGDFSGARRIIDVMEIPNIAPWNVLMKRSPEIFTEMIRDVIVPDEMSFSSAIVSCGASNALEQIHARAVKSGFDSTLSVNNALITSYAKSGSVGSALRCFRSSSERDLVTWTSMMSCFGLHGLADEAMECFEGMLAHGETPDKIAFLSVLSACSHGGRIRKGIEYFKLMTGNYRIAPDPEHYACLVDLVARSGLLDEAFALLCSVKTGESAYGAFLGACRAHGNSKLAELALEKLMGSELNVGSANYALMSNMYSSEGRWSNVARVRAAMRTNCGWKSPGFSWLEIDSVVHTFVSGDRAHRNSEDVYLLLDSLFRPIEEELILNQTQKNS